MKDDKHMTSIGNDAVQSRGCHEWLDSSWGEAATGGILNASVKWSGVIYVLAYLRTLYQLQRTSQLRKIDDTRYICSLRVTSYHTPFFWMCKWMFMLVFVSFQAIILRYFCVNSEFEKDSGSKCRCGKKWE